VPRPRVVGALAAEGVRREERGKKGGSVQKKKEGKKKLVADLTVSSSASK